MTARVDYVIFNVNGRPAPQGSKRIGAGGVMRESSAYLPAWRMAVKTAAYRWMRENGIGPHERPVIVGPVGVAIQFRMPAGVPYDGPPDGDKLTRAVWDALTQAGVIEDDGRVIDWRGTKRPAGDGAPGALIEVFRLDDLDHDSDTQ